MKYLLYISFLFSLLVIGCNDDDFTTSASSQLSFSNDTVRFDTVFSSLSSSTARLMVYNRNSKGISVADISLVDAQNSGFRINVDGMKGSSFQNVDILRKDSMYILVEVTPKTTSQDTPTRQQDIIRFTYNGISQDIILEAYAQDAYSWKGKSFASDTTISSVKPFLIYDSLVIEKDACLNIKQGTQFYFHDKAKMIVRGTLNTEGSFSSPVVFRGQRNDKLFDNLPYDWLPAQWDGIYFDSESYGNSMVHTNVRGTTVGLRFDSASVDQKKIDLKFCAMRNANEELIYADHIWMEASNCEFVNSGGAIIYIEGGSYRFTHCTISSNINTVATYDKALHLSNYRIDTLNQVIAKPLLRADFNNCIIWGKSYLEVNLDYEYKGDSIKAPFEHRFDHCLICAYGGTDDDRFINTQWSEDPCFKSLGNDDSYYFDFHIDSLSAAIGNGNSQYAIEFPTDLDGVRRPSGIVDIGAYQFK